MGQSLSYRRGTSMGNTLVGAGRLRLSAADDADPAKHRQLGALGMASAIASVVLWGAALFEGNRSSDTWWPVICSLSSSFWPGVPDMHAAFQPGVIGLPCCFSLLVRCGGLAGLWRNAHGDGFYGQLFGHDRFGAGA